MGRRGIIALTAGVVGIVAIAAVSGRRAASPDAVTPARAKVDPVRAPDLLAAASLDVLAIQGRVLERGEPVAGASILLTAEDPDAFSAARCPVEDDRPIFECGCAPVTELLGWRFVEGRGEVATIATARTAADGTFRLDGLAPGRYAVWAEAVGGSAVALDVASGGRVELALEPGIFFGGLARDEHGAPVAGARVVAFYEQHSRFFPTTTEADGQFRLGPLPAGDYVLVAAAPGYVPDEERSPSGESILYLRHARRIEGVVIRDGEPVAGARITAESYCSPIATRTDARGRFVLQRLRPERTGVAARSGEDGGAVAVDLAGGDRTDVVIALQRGGTLAGEVEDEGGAPVPGARVEVESLHDLRTEVTTGASGRWSLTGLPADSYVLRLQPPPGFLAPGFRRVRVAVGGVSRLRYRLLRAAGLSGVVVDERGEPVAGAEVVGHRRRHVSPLATDWDAHAYLRAASDRHGRFALDGAVAGAVTLVVKARGFVEGSLDAVAPGEVKITLRRGGRIDVEVQDEKGRALPGARLTATRQHPADGSVAWRDLRTASAGGRCTFDGLESGTYRVVAQAIPPGDHTTHVRTVAADADVQDSRATAVRLHLDPGLAITGRVVEEGSGRPLAGVDVYAEDEAADPPTDPGSDVRYAESGGQATTDVQGRFEISHLRPNRHTLRWSLDGYTRDDSERVVSPGEASVALTLRPAPKLTGRVLDDAGGPVHDFSVMGDPIHSADGRFAVPIQSTGERTISVVARGFAPLSLPLVLDDRTERDLGDLRLSRGRTVTISVRDEASGRPVGHARVRVGTASEKHASSLDDALADLYTEPEGTAVARDVPPTPLRVVVETGGFAPAVVPLAADARALMVSLGGGGRIQGTVRNADGQPVRNVPVEARAWSFHREGLTDEGGHFVLDALSPDDYVVDLAEGVAEGNAGLSHRRVRIAANETIRIDFTETRGATLAVLAPRGAMVYLARGALAPAPESSVPREVVRSALYPDFRRDGAFLFRGLPPGPYTVLCTTHPLADGEKRASLLRVDIAEADLEVRAAAPGLPLR